MKKVKRQIGRFIFPTNLPQMCDVHIFREPPVTETKQILHFKRNLELVTDPEELKYYREHAVCKNRFHRGEIVERVWDYDASSNRVLVTVKGNHERAFWIPHKPQQLIRHDPSYVIHSIGSLQFDNGRLQVPVNWGNVSTETYCSSCLCEQFCKTCYSS
mgnify:CR=1 FL=1